MLTCEWLRTLRIISYVPPHLGNIKSPVMMLSNIEVNNVTKPRRTHVMGFFFFSLSCRGQEPLYVGEEQRVLQENPTPSSIITTSQVNQCVIVLSNLLLDEHQMQV